MRLDYVENIHQGEIDSHENKNRAGDSSGPFFNLRNFVEDVADAPGAQSDQDGEDEDRESGADAVTGGYQDAGTVFKRQGDEAAEEQGCGNRAERQREEDAKGECPPGTEFADFFLKAMSEIGAGQGDADNFQ